MGKMAGKDPDFCRLTFADSTEEETPGCSNSVSPYAPHLCEHWLMLASFAVVILFLILNSYLAL